MADLNTLIVLARIVEAGSLSEAARRLGIPVSTVSRRVAALEAQLGVRLLERSTRRLRLTDAGAELMEHAGRAAEISDTVDAIVSNQSSRVHGILRLSAPPSISDSLLAPLIGAFQTAYPDVSVEVFVTDRFVDHVAEGVDVAFRVGPLPDSALIARRVLRYRHQLVASPSYLASHAAPGSPQELGTHRLLAFSLRRPEHRWTFVRGGGEQTEMVQFRPFLGINDYRGLAAAVLAGAGIGELPPIVRPDLLRDGHLVEVMPEWRFRTVDLSMVHTAASHTPRPVRVFKAFAAEMCRTLFPGLPD